MGPLLHQWRGREEKYRFLCFLVPFVGGGWQDFFLIQGCIEGSHQSLVVCHAIPWVVLCANHRLDNLP